MPLISNEKWGAAVRRALELAKEHATDEERSAMEALHFVGTADNFEGENGVYGILKVLDD